MNPETRQRVDLVLGWMGYSLSYTDQDICPSVDAPVLSAVRTRQDPAGRGAPPRTMGSAADRPDAKIVLRRMLEAFVEGLVVCTRLSARFALATYRYAGQRLEHLRDPERASRNGPYNDPRPTLRMRLDDGLERVLDALETRVRALSFTSVLGHARAAFAAKKAEADVRIARIWWPEKEREDTDMDGTASPPVAPPEPAQVAQLDPVRATRLSEPVARPGMVTLGRKDAPMSPDLPTAEMPRPPREPIPVTVQIRELPEAIEPPAVTTPPSDLAAQVSEPLSGADRDDRPWFRWSALLSFFGRRETRVPSVFDRSRDLDTATDDSAPEHVTPDEAVLHPLERLEKMLSSNNDTPPTDDEIEALSRRRPRELWGHDASGSGSES